MTTVTRDEDPMGVAQALGLPTAELEPEKVITMTYSGPWQVKLTYFKDTGKFYSGGEYMSKQLNLWEIWDELKTMLRSGIRPGLVDGECDFYVYVEVPEHPHAHPVLITPESLRR
jgi:hypothetical protein